MVAFTDGYVEIFTGEGDGFCLCAFDQLWIVPGDETRHQNDAAQQHEDEGGQQGAQKSLVAVVRFYAVDDGHWRGRLLLGFFHVTRAACGQRDFLGSDMRRNDASGRFGLCGLIAAPLLFHASGNDPIGAICVLYGSFLPLSLTLSPEGERGLQERPFHKGERGL